MCLKRCQPFFPACVPTDLTPWLILRGSQQAAVLILSEKIWPEKIISCHRQYYITVISHTLYGFDRLCCHYLVRTQCCFLSCLLLWFLLIILLLYSFSHCLSHSVFNSVFLNWSTGKSVWSRFTGKFYLEVIFFSPYMKIKICAVFIERIPAFNFSIFWVKSIWIRCLSLTEFYIYKLFHFHAFYFLMESHLSFRM